MLETLRQEFEYYLQHQAELVKQYGGKVIAIKDGQVIGVFDTELQAVQQTSKDHQPGTFLVQRCEPGPEAYTQVFHSRVSFA